MYPYKKNIVSESVFSTKTDSENIDFKIACNEGTKEDASVEIDNDTGSKQADVIAPTFAHASAWNGCLLYSTTPVIDSNHAAFAYEWKNPFPEKKIIKIKAIHTCHDRDQCAVLFSILAITHEK